MSLKQILLLLLFLSGTISCRDLGKKTSKHPTASAPSSTRISLDSVLLGKWFICSEGSGDEIIQSISYNVCPEIIFNRNRTVLLIKNNQASETMKWEINGDTLRLDHLAFWTKDSTVFFSDSLYKITWTEDSISYNLRIKQPDRKYFFNLGRLKQSTVPSF